MMSVITGKTRSVLPPPRRIGENVSADMMSQLDPAAEVGHGPLHEGEHILGRGEEWTVLALAGSNSLFSSSTPYFLTFHCRDDSHLCHLYPQCLAQSGMLQTLRIFVEWINT